MVATVAVGAVVAMCLAAITWALLELHTETVRLRQHDLDADRHICQVSRATRQALEVVITHDHLRVTVPPVGCEHSP